MLRLSGQWTNRKQVVRTRGSGLCSSGGEVKSGKGKEKVVQVAKKGFQGGVSKGCAEKVCFFGGNGQVFIKIVSRVPGVKKKGTLMVRNSKR